MVERRQMLLASRPIASNQTTQQRSTLHMWREGPVTPTYLPSLLRLLPRPLPAQRRGRKGAPIDDRADKGPEKCGPGPILFLLPDRGQLDVAAVRVLAVSLQRPLQLPEPLRLWRAAAAASWGPGTITAGAAATANVSQAGALN